MKNRHFDDYYHTDIDYLDLSDAVSAHECTGLIPAGDAKSGDQDIETRFSNESRADGKKQVKEENYRELYSFGVPLKCGRKRQEKGEIKHPV